MCHWPNMRQGSGKTIGWPTPRHWPVLWEGTPSTPESSLTWCLAHLSKSPPDSEGELDKRSRFAQWRALVAIRTQHIKGDKAGITRFRTSGGLRPLLELLGHPGCSRKTLDLTLSILANCCTEQETRTAVRKLDGISIVVDVMKRNVAHETIQNRAARALGNLAMDSENSALIHSAGGVPLLLLCMSLPSTPSSPTPTPPKDTCPKMECAQSASRALLYLSETPGNRLSLLVQGALSAVAPFISPEYPPALRRAALRTLHELTRGCGPECAREASRSGVLAQLGVVASGESGKSLEELALKTLANLCSQGCLRPLVGSLGVIPKFTTEAKKDPHRSGVFFKALCLCCKEAVNRAKVKESGGLEVLVGFLAKHPGHPLARLAILACVDFVFDEAAVEQLQELGLVPLMVARLVALTAGDKADATAGGGTSKNELMPPSCLDSFDFAPFEDCKKEEGGREQGSSSFLRLRSWLLSEGMISSEEDLLDSSNSTETDWTSPPTQSSPNTDCLTPLKPCSPSDASTSKKEALNSCKAKFSSPHRRRPRTPGAVSPSAKPAADTPPSTPRPFAYRHPYHPEPWTPESPVLLLLSRFSHAAEPSPALLTWSTIWGLLRYLGQHRDPSGRCFRLLCRLSCNPGCLRALVRGGAVALIHHVLCQNDGGERRLERVRAKVKQLGVTLLNNLHIQCESSFGAGILAHVMLSGSEADRVNCALSLPLISSKDGNSNKPLLRKLLLDSGGLLLALQPLSCRHNADTDSHTPECQRLLSTWPESPHHSLYFSLLIGCLTPLVSSAASPPTTGRPTPPGNSDRAAPPPSKKPRHADLCPYAASDFDITLLLDDGAEVPANRDAVGGDESGSEYFRAMLNGAFSEASSPGALRIKDVTRGSLTPVLHYLHGCRLAAASQEAEKCCFLDGLATCRPERTAFQDSPLGAAMVGACRFLATDLKGELEELCVAGLFSKRATPTPETVGATVEEHLASRTSELDLTCVQLQLEPLLEKTLETDASGPKKEITDSICPTKSLNEKSPSKSSAQLLKDEVPEEGGVAGGVAGGSGAALLPDVYRFAQRHSYPALRRACLALLLGGRSLPFSARQAAECLQEVAGGADCVDTLKQDILSLAADALN
ncbi:armadillo repeat-containing protein 5 [Stigmatopora nigra]